jgi:hypothetical protein
VSGRIPGPLKPEQLRRTCDPSTLDFKTTADLDPLRENIGQELAMRALRFGLGVDHPGYNIFVTGLPGSGRSAMIRQALAGRAVDEPVPSDWCYVYNFDAAREPKALELPAGRARSLRSDVNGMLEELEASLPKALQADEVRKERDEITSRAMEMQRKLIEQFQQMIEDEPHATLVQTPAGFSVTAVEPVASPR